MTSFIVHKTFLVLASFVALTSALKSLSLKVTGPTSVNSVDGFKVSITLTNSGDQILKVLNDPRGPLHKLPTDAFVITDPTGAQPKFTGVQVKYVPQTAIEAGGYTVLAPHQSFSMEHSLGDAYDFTTPGATDYNVLARNAFLIVNDDSTVSTIYADTTGHLASVLPGKLAPTRLSSMRISRRANFVDCSSDQQAVLIQAAAAAKTYALGAAGYVNLLDSAPPRYDTWFGAFSDTRHDLVTSHFNKISGNSFESFTYDCTCPHQDTFAYVYPDQFGTIYLCPVFWRAPLTGSDSQGGTLVHEASHFTVNGGTQDKSYGQPNCEVLAQTNPDFAVINADSHEYFAENSPALL